MDNVLILDRERTSGFLIKSILLGRGCNVSISPTLKDARAKLQTGLFDALVLDNLAQDTTVATSNDQDLLGVRVGVHGDVGHHLLVAKA